MVGAIILTLKGDEYGRREKEKMSGAGSGLYQTTPGLEAPTLHVLYLRPKAWVVS